MRKTEIDILGALNAHAFLLEVLLAASITQGARAAGADPAESGAASASTLAALGVGNLVRPPPQLAAREHQMLIAAVQRNVNEIMAAAVARLERSAAAKPPASDAP
jgi:hypothetical protein